MTKWYYINTIGLAVSITLLVACIVTLILNITL